MIRHDVSNESVVTKCTDCDYWAAFSWTKEEAFRVGETHLMRVHGVSQEVAANARRQHRYRQRHADKS